MNVLAIGAHFDDVELGCAGSLLKWKKEGANLAIFVATDSSYSDPDHKVIRSKETAQTEGRSAAQKMGAKLFEGDLKTLEIESNEALNSILIQCLGQFKPDLVLTHWKEDVHHDHRAVFQSTLHCTKHVPKLLMYRSNWYTSDTPFRSNFFVNISGFISHKIDLIRTHASENLRTKGKWEEWCMSMSRIYGIQCGCDHAEAFELVKWVA